jgi:hypothetical protein
VATGGTLFGVGINPAGAIVGQYRDTSVNPRGDIVGRYRDRAGKDRGYLLER